jgi:hypothetical protein
MRRVSRTAKSYPRRYASIREVPIEFSTEPFKGRATVSRSFRQFPVHLTV